MRKIVCLGLVITSIGLVMTGCKKQGQDSVMAAANNSLALMIAEDIRQQVHMAASAQSGLYKVEMGPMIPQCATVTLSNSAGYPKTLTITYGDGCMDNNGITRRGSLVCVFSGPYDDAGTSIEIALVGFKMNQYAVTGNEQVVVDGLVGPYRLNAPAMNIAWSGSSMSWSGNYTTVWEEGAETKFLDPAPSMPEGVLGYLAFEDDKWHITGGTGSGNDRDGHPFTFNVKSHLEFMAGCRYITMGQVDLLSANRSASVVDYGEGGCDPQATLDADGDLNNFILP